MEEQSKYQYICSKGHQIYSEKEHSKCLVVSLGSPCKGVLNRVGPGSRVKPDRTKGLK